MFWREQTSVLKNVSVDGPDAATCSERSAGTLLGFERGRRITLLQLAAEEHPRDLSAI